MSKGLQYNKLIHDGVLNAKFLRAEKWSEKVVHTA